MSDTPAKVRALMGDIVTALFPEGFLLIAGAIVTTIGVTRLWGVDWAILVAGIWLLVLFYAVARPPTRPRP